MDYSHIALLMAAVGIAVLIAEIFIPSGGVLSVIMLVCLGVSIYCAAKAWWGTNPTLWWTYLLTLLVLIPVTIGTAFTVLPHTSLGKTVLLEAPEPDEVVPLSEEARLQQWVGQHGTAVTPLTPGGLVLVSGERVHAVSEGMIVERDQEVEIVAVRGLRLVVRPAPPRAAQDDLFPEVSDSVSEPPLDFQLPQS